MVVILQGSAGYTVSGTISTGGTPFNQTVGGVPTAVYTPVTPTGDDLADQIANIYREIDALNASIKIGNLAQYPDYPTIDAFQTLANQLSVQVIDLERQYENTHNGAAAPAYLATDPVNYYRTHPNYIPPGPSSTSQSMIPNSNTLPIIPQSPIKSIPISKNTKYALMIIAGIAIGGISYYLYRRSKKRY